MVMQRATHPSPIAIISDHIEAWRRENRWSRETVADMIVQAHIRIGAEEFTGIKFEPQTTDTFERMRVNADRIFRWLDDRTKDKNLLVVNLLWSVLSALPEDRRVLLLNDLLHPVSVHVAGMIDGDAEPTAAEIAAGDSASWWITAPRRPSPSASCWTACIPARSSMPKRSSA